MKRLKPTAAFTLAIIVLMVLPGCISQQEEPPTTITKTATITEPTTVTPPTTSEVTNPYIWSGKLDGDGIPPNFFSDLNVRKAFAYAFDWETYVNEAMMGEALTPPTPVIAGFPYQHPNLTGYALDLEKSEELFRAAWDGQVWKVGFKMTMLYYSGNDLWKVACEILKTNIESLNEKFYIYMRGVPWSTLLTEMNLGRVPLAVNGWAADYPDPHNLVHPYMHSQGYWTRPAGYQNAHVDELIEEGINTADHKRRQEIYFELQEIYVEEVPSFVISQAVARHWERDWVNGWHLNPTLNNYWFDIEKSPDAKNPNTLILATTGEPVSFDPAWAYDGSSQAAIDNIYEKLIWWGHDPEKVIPNTFDPVDLTSPSDIFIPLVAEEVPSIENGGISLDSLTYTFKVRDGLTFPNGNPLTPEDVEYSFERVLVMDRAGGPAWMLFEALFGIYGTRDSEGTIVVPFEDINNAVEVVGDAVVFHLTQPFPPFIQIVTSSMGAIIDKEWAIEQGCWPGTAETYQTYNNPNTAPLQEITMGSGPFNLERWDHAVEYSLIRNNGYWRDPAKLERVLVKFIEEWSIRKLLFQEGDVDLCVVPAMNNQELETAAGIRYVKELPILLVDSFIFSLEIQP